ncbi:MAG TPA: C40 family peptidase [Thermomicrobiales bacterium]|nr:C40 family peptidase [Thermomicrobiales bacterium]
MSRLDAISLAILIELGLTSSDAGWRLADAADSGPQVVRVAKKYKGATYKWGGASPRGFDCSGFIWYVCKKATGKSITRGVNEQSKHGRSVSRGKWRLGDLVFFENTIERGLSHVGIYVKRDDFIHAENERTGVVISSPSSDYFSKHYAVARRFL